MAKIFWKSRKMAAVLTAIFIIYLTIRVQHYNHKTFIFLPKIHPNEVWEFVADFSNMKFLNPTLVEFNIISESGNYKHWKYSVEYSEKLSHWPYLPNHAVARFDIAELSSKGTYSIRSNHRTCLLMGLYCLNSESEFKFTQSNSSEGSECEEVVNYQCPTILSSFCRREVMYQRNAIISNLRKYFSSKKR